MPSFLKATIVVALCCASWLIPGCVCVAQSTQNNPTSFEASAGYTYEFSNAPAGSCGCFSLNGGFGSFVYNAPHDLSIVADVSATHANQVAGTTQSITYTNFLFGPRYSLSKLSGRFTPYGQVLLGGSHESSSVTQASSLTGFAVSAGGGAALRLSPHVALTLFEADWLHSQLSNGSNNRQNTLRVNTGITFRFGMK